MSAPNWSDVPVSDLVISLYRGRTVALNDAEVRFTGTHRGTDHTGSPYIVVHGVDSAGRNHEQAFAADGVVRVQSKEVRSA